MESLRTSILVTADARGVAAGLAPALVAFNQFESRAVRALTRTGQILDKFGAKRFAGFAIGAAGLGLLTAGFIAALGPAIRFEDAFAGVLKTVDGTPAQLAEIREELIGLSQEMPISANQLADIAASAGQLGVQANRVVEFTKVVGQLAATTDLGFEGAARNLARFLNVVDGGVQNVDAVSNVLVDLGNNFATTESQILTFATRLGPAFSAAGATSEEILAIATAFSSLGIQAELGGSALNRVITEIADSARIGDGRLRVFGETAGILPETFQDIARENPVEAFRLFVSGLGEMQAAGTSISPTLEALGLNGIRITQVLTTAANQTGILSSALELADGALERNNARQIEYARRSETTASRIEILKNRINALAISAGTPALDGLVAVIDRLGDEVVRLTGDLAPLGGEVVSAFQELANAITAVNSAFGDGGALGRAGDLLVGLSVAAGAAFKAISALGPLGPILVGVLAAFVKIPGLANATGLALGRFALAGQAASLNSTKLASSLKLLTGALRVLSSVAGVLTLIEIGNAISNANELAAEAADTFRNDFNEALNSGNYDNIASGVASIRKEIEQLEGQDKVPDGLADSWSGLGNSIISAVQIVTPFTENTMLNARREAEALGEELEDLGLSAIKAGDGTTGAAAGMGTFAARLGRAASQLGLTRDEVLTLGGELGLLESITNGTAEEFNNAIAKLEEFGFRAELAGEGFQSLRVKVAEGSASLEEIASALGVSTEALSALDQASDLVDLDKLFADDPAEKLDQLDVIAAVLTTSFEGLAQAIGVGTGELVLQEAAVKGLAGSLGNLEAAIKRATDLQAQLKFQQDLLSDATERYDDALAGVRDGLATGELEEYAQAVLDLTVASAANAETDTEALRTQAELKRSFIENAIAAGANREEVLRLAEEVLGLPPSAIIDIQATGLDVATKVERINDQVDALDREVFVRMGIIDRASGEIRLVQQTADEFALRTYEGILDVNDVPAKTKAELLEQFLGSEFERNFIASLDADTRDALAEITGVTAEALAFDDILAIADFDADGQLARDEVLALALLINNEINKDFVAGLTAEDRGVLAAIAGVEPSLLNFSDIVAIADLDADGTPAEGELFATIQFLNEYGDIVEEALLEADGVPASMVIAQLMEDLGLYGEQEPEANPKVNPTQVDDELDRMLTRFADYAEQTPTAAPQVNPEQPDNELERLLNRFEVYAEQRPEADLLADPADANEDISNLNLRLDAYEQRTPRPTIDANTSSADKKLGGLIDKLARIRDKTITITTRTVGGSSGATFSANGAIFRRFEEGGISGAASGPAMIPAPTGVAQLYSAAPPGTVRVHSEPETGGEAYIPLGRPKRQRSLRLWRETGKILGAPEAQGLSNGAIMRGAIQAFQNGGLSQVAATASLPPISGNTNNSSINIDAPITIDLAQLPSGTDLPTVVAVVGERVEQAFNDFADRISNAP